MPPATPTPTSECAVLCTLRAAARQFAWTGQTLLLAVSGGADSMALLRGLLLLVEENSTPVRLTVGHVDHQLRGAAARDDSAWLESVCRRLDVPFLLRTADVIGVRNESNAGLEEAARHERYRLLEAMAGEVGCSQILLAHTADDQVETVLHHLIRGTSLAGLAGMPQQRELTAGMTITRPLLTVSREDVVEFLGRLDQDYREDASNRDEAMTRNRVRHLLLPLLREQFNPRAAEAVLRLSHQARDAAIALEWVAQQWLDRIAVTVSPDEVVLDCAHLRDVPRHLVREMLVVLWKRQHWPRQQMRETHWDRAAGVLLGGEPAVDLPAGLHVRRRRQQCIIHAKPISSPTASAPVSGRT